mgnify:CR=1 FL=1
MPASIQADGQAKSTLGAFRPIVKLVSSATSTPRLPAQTSTSPPRLPVQTPVPTPTMDILEELLGETGTIAPLPLPKQMDVATQADEMEPPPKRQKTEEPEGSLLVLNNLNKVIGDGFSRMASALETNSRAVRLVERAVRDQTDTFNRVHRTLDRMVEQKRFEERQKGKMY